MPPFIGRVLSFFQKFVLPLYSVSDTLLEKEANTVDVPDFGGFLDYLEENKQQLFGSMLRMDIIDAKWPLSPEDFNVFLQKVQNNAIEYSIMYSQRMLYAYHQWLSEQ